MSNLLKRATIIDKDKRIIDYNKTVEEKIAMHRKAADSDGFVEGLYTSEVEQLVDEDGNPVETPGQAEEAVETINLDEVRAQADAIIEDARAQAEQIVNAANAESDSIRRAAYDESYARALADADALAVQKEMQLNAEYDRKCAQLKAEYDDLKASMEPELVDVILEVFSNVTHAIAEDNKEIVLSLVNHVLQDANISNEFVIKVSKDDYSFMAQNQGKLYCAMNKDIQVDIIEDSKLSKGQCLIQADSGVYDCSLDIQLENLIKEIKILSCNG